MGNGKIYEELIEWFRKCGAYVPESTALYPLMQETYTVEEAELLMGMPLTLCEIDELVKNKRMDTFRTV